MSGEIDTKYTDVLVCPYCGYQHRDTFEIEDAEEASKESYCDSCGKMFFYETETRRTFSSWAQKAGA